MAMLTVRHTRWRGWHYLTRTCVPVRESYMPTSALPLTFRLDRMTPRDCHVLEAFLEGGLAGSLEWNIETGIVRHLWVLPPLRNKGIATALWRHAQTLGVRPPEHSTLLTNDGHGWKESL
jgi:GNAT superfamily N-acetyltransferase